MASTDKPDPESVVKSEASGAPPPRPPLVNCVGLDVALRALLFAASLTAVVVMVTAKQTELVTATVPGLPKPVTVPKEAKFSDSPAFIYFVAALSVAGLYSIISTLASLSIIHKPEYATNFLLYFAFFDLVFLGIVASATGAAGGVAYVGLKGNSHVGWNKVCNVYDKFCRHVAGSLVVSLFASVVMVLLTMLSVCSIYSRIPK